MRYLGTPTFTEKLKALASDPRTLTQVSGLLQRVEAAEKSELLSSAALTLLANEIYVLRSGEIRVFCSFGTDVEGEYLLLLDIAEAGHAPSRAFRTIKDPRTNSVYNPRTNSSINPRVNSSLNPRINTSLNPRINSSLNPRINSSLNPRINSSINPRINSSINPRINSSLNPRINRSFGGPFLYSLDLNQEGFLIRANDTVSLFFDGALSFTGFGVKNGIGGYTLFDSTNEWIGQLVPDKQGGFLRFDTNNDWVGIVV